MCGILGEFVYNNHSLIDRSRFLSLLELSRNRGPDSQGYFTNNKNFQFGFNRLSILDLSENGNQPIHSPSGRYTMVFNGEIYNYQDLRTELISKGHTFHSQSDTEVIIVAYKEWGIECLSRFVGMFAFALWDRKKKELILARDRFGIKPLYYSLQNKLFAGSHKTFKFLQNLPLDHTIFYNFHNFFQSIFLLFLIYFYQDQRI